MSPVSLGFVVTSGAETCGVHLVDSAGRSSVYLLALLSLCVALHQYS